MNFAIVLSWLIGFIGGCCLCGYICIVNLPKRMGTVRVIFSDGEEPVVYLESSVPIKELCDKNTATFYIVPTVLDSH